MGNRLLVPQSQDQLAKQAALTLQHTILHFAWLGSSGSTSAVWRVLEATTLLHVSQEFLCASSFDPHNQPMRWVLLSLLSLATVEIWGQIILAPCRRPAVSLPLTARCQVHPPPLGCDEHKCLQTMPDAPGAEPPPVENLH